MDLSRWLLIACFVTLAAQSGSSGETRVVCYYTNWSVYRPGTAKFNPQNINPYLCTHLIYAFGGFTKENTLKPFDKYQDIEKGGYAKFTGLKTYNPNLKTMIAIGGWNEGSSRFSSLVSSSERRRELVKNAIKFLRQNKFDGLDLDWEYPAFRDGGKPKDRANYAKLVQELREEFEKESEATGRPRLLLTMAVPAGIEYIDKGYDVPKLNRYLDWMNILSYDYHSAFEPAVNHHAPLYPLEAASEYNYDSELNIDYTIKHYLEAGADRDKLVLGIPTYGRSYTLFNPDSTALGAPADGPGEQGEATREKGYLAYYEICESLLPKGRSKRAIDDDDEDEDTSEEEEEWTVIQPNPDAMGPYAYRANQWVGYDDIDIAKKKAEYVAEKGLGGIMFWSIDNDDFRGKCHGKPYPLIEAAKSALYKSLGITEKVAPPKKTQSSSKRTRPKPSKSDSEEKDVSKNTIKSNRNKNRISDSDTRESTTSSSSRRRQNLKRTSTTQAPSSAATPDWGLNTPEPPTTPDPGTDFKCEEEGFFPHPRDCKKYFWCLDSGPSNLGIVAHQFTCPSGLYFNKAADSCDFARNVLCNKKKAAVTSAPPKYTTSGITSSSTTSTTAAPRTTTTASRISPQLANLFTTRRPLPKITAATSRTTLLSRLSSTTTSPSEEEYEDEEIVEDDTPGAEEDPKVIKELIDLIKKLGGIEQLEKHLQASANTQGTRITTPPTVSRLLYERVLSQARTPGERAPPQINSRGPQAAGLEKLNDPEIKSSRWEKPQYTTINRHRPSTTTTEEAETYDRESEESQEDVNESPSSPSSTVRNSLPQYVNIRRGRPSSTTEDPESSARNALYDRGSEETSDVDDVKNGVQGFEYSNIRRFRPEKQQEVTTSKYKTIQRARPTTTETILEDISENSSFKTTSPVEVSSTYISSTEKPVQTSPKYATVARFPSTNIPQIIETTTIHTSNNDITDSNDVNVEIASPSFASENGIIKNKDNSILNAQISLLSNTVKSKDDAGITSSSIPFVSYSTEVTVSEDPFFSTSKGTPLFVKRTRPTTTTTTTEKQPETTSQSTSDKKVSFNRVYSNVRRTPAQNRARVSNDNNISKTGSVKNSDNLLGETNNNVVEYNLRSRVRKIRSTTPSSSQENTTDADNNDTNYGNRRASRPQIRFGEQKSNSVLRNVNQEIKSRNFESIATSGESQNKPTFRSRRLQTSSTSQRSDEEEGEPTTHRAQPIRRYRPSFKDFGPDLSSLTALDSSKRNSEEVERSGQLRNTQVIRKFRPSFTSTKAPIEDSEDSDSSITPVRAPVQRTFAPRGRFTTVRTIPIEKDLNEEASEASVIPRARKLSISRFTPRPFSKVSNEVLDEIDDADAQEENDLVAEVSFDSAPIGKARLTAPVITVSEDSQINSTSTLPLATINVTKVINSNILLGQSNNRSGILLLRRPSKPTTNVSQVISIDDNSEGIHLSESNIEEKEQNEDNVLPVDRPRKRIIVKKLRPKTVSDTETLSSAATERIEITSPINKEIENNEEPLNKEKPRVRKVLRRRPATSTIAPNQIIISTEATLDQQQTTYGVSIKIIEEENLIDEQKAVETTTPNLRRRKVIRKKLKPVLTEEGKQRILQTKDESIIEEKDVKENKDEENEEPTTLKPTEQSMETTSITTDSDVKFNNETVETSTASTDSRTRPTFKIVRKPLDTISSTEPSTTSGKFSRRYNIGPFTTPVLPSERDTATEKSRAQVLPRRPVFNARPVNRRPFTTPSTTTTDEDEDYNIDEYTEEVGNGEEKLVFVPVDKLFTRGPVKPVEEENEESDQESDDEESEEEQPNQVSSTQKPINRFAPGRRPPIIPNRAVLQPSRESNRPVNIPQGVKPTEEGGRRFNRPIAFQPNRSNRFGTTTTTAQVETATRPYIRKFSPNKSQPEITPTENINIESVSAKHRQLFSNPKRFTTIKSSLQNNDSDSTTEYGSEVTTSGYESEGTTLQYEFETVTESIMSEADSEEWLSSKDSTEDPVTEGDNWEKWIRNEINTNTDISLKDKSENEETTIDPNLNVSTESLNATSNDTVKTSVHLDRLFAISRVVEVSSKEDKHKLNSKNQTRLVEEGKIKLEMKPTLDKIGEVSRFTLIKIVEGDIPIYLTNLSREYPVDNPPFNPIRIDEARNARALSDFSDSGKENLIASESVNAAYNHKNGVIELIQTPVELDYKTDTDDKGNKVYVIESTTLVDNTDTPTETEPTEAETEYMTTNIPTITERMFVPGAIDIEALRSSNVNVVTPKSVESSTLPLEALFGINDTISSSNRQSKTVSGPQPFVVYASPIAATDIQVETSNLNTNDTESTREESGRSIEGFVKIQIVQDGIKTFVKGEEFQGIPAALDIITEKESSSTTIKPINDINLLNQTTEQPSSTTTLPIVSLTPNPEENISNLTTSQTAPEYATNSTSTSPANDILFTTTTSSVETTDTSNMTNTSSSTTASDITVTTNEETTVTEVSESTTPIPETIKPVLVKTLSSSLPSNNTASKFIKNRPKLSFPRRFQPNGNNSSSTTRVPFNPLARSNKNRTISVSLDSKNIPYTTPKYNRTNSYTSGKSRFSATRTQNVPIDTRKKLEANKFKPSTTTTASPVETKIVNVPVEPTTSKVTIRRFKPRVSPFAARRTSTTSTEPSTQDSSVTDIPLDDSTAPTERQKNPSVRPTFFPRRTSNRFSNSERGRGTVPTIIQTTTNEPTTSRYSSLRKRTNSIFLRKSSISPSLVADSTTTEAAEASTTTRPNRLIVRKFYNKQRGANNGGATQNNTNANTVEESAATTKTPQATTRKPFRVGVRRRIPPRVTTTTTPVPTTTFFVETTPYDQQSFSTIQQSYEKDTIDNIRIKKLKINKRPLSNKNELVPQNGSQETTVNEDEEVVEGINRGKKYSSVIKEDRTLVQQEVTVTPSGPKEGLIGSIGNDVTADVALAAHQLLSAPLPTSSTYDSESDYITTPEEKTFTRAYLLASISPPIINNDYISTTEVPVVVTKLNFPTKGRRISTTNTPQVIYSSTFTQPTVRRRKPSTPAAFEKIAPVTNHYRTVVDYEYYDDDDIRFVGKIAQQEKVIIRGSGVIQCLDQGNFPHPNSCKKFISCAKMETGGVYGWEYTCPKGLSFDPVGGICNWSAGLGCKEH